MAEQTNIIKALVKVQEEITNPANTSTNPFFKSKYAPLNKILDLVRPLLTKNDLFLTQDTGSATDGSLYIQTKLYHISGECIKSGELELKPDKDSVQGMGSAITYGRRYQLSAMLGITGEDDNDGNTPKQSNNVKLPDKPKTPKVVKSKPKPPAPPNMTETKGNSPSRPKKEVKPVWEQVQGINKTMDKQLDDIVNKKSITAPKLIKLGQNLLGQGAMTKEELGELKKVLA